ncbi:hypothetical protein CEXT_350561 [Caerostris extrusa]|uniref:Uncharacterized protein n=1 Tax=Caerostris extrusa TaxID=172846 RepID=A0AAV4Y279_CAEEX|nr:hypothetical protein CEXT_350561 [Caerostris extrusa]
MSSLRLAFASSKQPSLNGMEIRNKLAPGASTFPRDFCIGLACSSTIQTSGSSRGDILETLTLKAAVCLP